MNEKKKRNVIGHDKIECSSCGKHLLDIILIESNPILESVDVIVQCSCGENSWRHRYKKNGYKILPVGDLIVNNVDVNETDNLVVYELIE